MSVVAQSSSGGCSCMVCGKWLTDPISVELRVGPVCRGSGKYIPRTKDRKRKKTKQLSLFDDMKAHYEWGITDGVIWVIDLDRGKSVTNDLANVVMEIDAGFPFPKEGTSIFDYPLMYRDTTKTWDGIILRGIPQDREKVREHGFNEHHNYGEDFYPIRETDFQVALQKCLKWNALYPHGTQRVQKGLLPEEK